MKIMATITAFKFDTPDGAEQMLALVQDLAKGQLITLDDAAIVTWPQGKKKPKTHQLTNLIGAGALSGAFWGMLFGLIFLIPFWGMTMGAAMGALAGKFSDYGIDDSFIKSVGKKATEGTSELFLMTSGAVMDKVSDAVKEKGWKFEIISTNLSKEQEAQLCEDFGLD
jgi:uncharacterized membrane protein